MRFLKGRCRILFEMIDATHGNWVHASGSWYNADQLGFEQMQRAIGDMAKRADRRRIRAEYMPGNTAEPLIVVSFADVQDLIDTEWVDANGEQPTEPWVVINGNPHDGFSLTGPFTIYEDAVSYGNQLDGDWWVLKVFKP